MTIKVTYNITDVYMSQSVSPVYINVSYSDGGASGGGVWGSITGTLSNQTDLQTALDLKLDESTIDGGTEGQILSKASATDFDFAWINNYAKYLATNVRNQTGSTIDAFQVVYISGATGNKPLVSLADADTEATSSKTYGVTATSIANNGTGDVVTAGELSGINTSAFNEGDLLWLSTTAGGVVTSPPAEPAHAVFIGYVVRSHPTLGVIDVAIQNGYELNELHGVQITTPTDNQGLFYNSTSTLWENKSITTALGYTPVPTTRNITINGVTYDLSADRTYTISTGISGSGASGQVTYWTGASAVSGSNNLFWDNANGRLGIGTNAPANSLQVVGTGIRGQNVLTDATAKGFDIVSGHYTNSQSPFAMMSSVVNLTQSILWIGGGNSSYNSATDIRFFTGTNNTTLTGTEKARINSIGNLLIGSTTDNGQRLQVYGDTLLRGSGATSATTALTVQNSSSTDIFRVRNDGQVGVNSVSNFIGRTIELYGATSTNIAYTYIGGVLTTTTGSSQSISIGTIFQPTSGASVLNTVNVSPAINQTGGANGITRGLYVNPTLTSAADFRAIETTAGNVLFGSNFFWDNTNGRLGIGTNAPTNALHISGFNTTNSQLRVGNLEFQTYSQGNSWFGDNVYYNAPNGFAVRNTGTTGLFYFLGAEGQFRMTTSLTAGSFITSSTAVQLKINANGTFAVGAAIDNSQNVVTGANLVVTSNGRTLLGFTSDQGTRLAVNGDTLLRGSGNTSATTALTVQNSDGTNMWRFANDGRITIGTSSSIIYPAENINQSGALSISGTGLQFAFSKSTQEGYGLYIRSTAAAQRTNTTGDAGIIDMFHGFAPTSGNGTYHMVKVTGTINQTGGANGVTRGIYVNPTLTSAADFRAIEVSAGITVLAPSVTARASLRIPSGTAPTTPNDGDIWFDGTDIKMRIGGVTKTFTLI